MLYGSDGSVWGAGRDREWQWHIPRIILVQSECIPSPRGWSSECFTQTRYTMHALFAIQIPQNQSQKKLGVLIYFSLSGMHFPRVPTKEPSTV